MSSAQHVAALLLGCIPATSVSAAQQPLSAAEQQIVSAFGECLERDEPNDYQARQALGATSVKSVLHSNGFSSDVTYLQRSPDLVIYQGTANLNIFCGVTFLGTPSPRLLEAIGSLAAGKKLVPIPVEQHFWQLHEDQERDLRYWGLPNVQALSGILALTRRAKTGETVTQLDYHDLLTP
jgi:hypothetical protein